MRTTNAGISQYETYEEIKKSLSDDDIVRLVNRGYYHEQSMKKSRTKRDEKIASQTKRIEELEKLLQTNA